MLVKLKGKSMAFSGGRAEFLKEAVHKVTNIPGDFVECGVWRGGNCMLMATELQKMGQNRKIWLYDTFEGMPKPGEHDVKFDGKKAKDIWYEDWCRASLSDVEKNMVSTGYTNWICIVGDVLKTIPKNTPKQIALLRLDTDFYESTKHELIHLYPLLEKDGVLIIDDYHSWQGSRKACDEYFNGKQLTRIGTSNAAYLVKNE